MERRGGFQKHFRESVLGQGKVVERHDEEPRLLSQADLGTDSSPITCVARAILSPLWTSVRGIPPLHGAV